MKIVNNNNKIYFKIVFILVLILLLMIPNSMLQSLIRERQFRKTEVINEIASSWGDEQTIIGPVIHIPYSYKTTNSTGIEIEINSSISILPEELKIDSEVVPYKRNRSIYTAILYKTKLHGEGNFIIPDLIKEIGKENVVIEYQNASLNIGISDVQAMETPISLQVNGKEVEMEPGTNNPFVLPKGVQSKITFDSETKEIVYSFNVGLKGNESLFFEPSAKNTIIKMKSTWPSPSFIGKILPQKRDISSEGFTANWIANKYNRNYPQIWTGDKYRIGNTNSNGNHYSNNKQIPMGKSNNSFGVRLVEPVDFYLKNIRAAKYALLIISLSFGIFFFFEMLKKNKIHAIQYIMIGFALSLFYFLLLSITEHLGFDIAYLISAGATIGLITVYAANILKYGKSIFILFTALSFVYGYIFIILQLEDYALLAGSIGLFAILAIVMYFSKNVNWYTVQSEPKGILDDENTDGDPK